ncbi:MAG: hypothetical protein ACQEP7_03625 [bacterium]
MEFVAENHSMYPRVGDSDSELRLRRAHHDYDHGDITEDELEEIVDSYVEEVIEEQVDAGLDIVTDGMIRWYDHISHLAGKIAGADVGGLVRYFDTNYLVREAEITGALDWQSPLLVSEYEFASEVSSRPVKKILTGPLTMSRYSVFEDSSYTNDRQLAEDYTKVLKQEIRALADAGLQHLQIEEPSLLQSPQESSWVLELLDDLFTATDIPEIRLATYFGDADPVYEDLQQTEADVLLLDFTYSETLLDTIAEKGSEKRIGFGMLDGRNTKLAQTDEIVNKIESVTDSLPEGQHPVSFSSSLDYLPRDRARLKLDRLAAVCNSLNEGADL